MEIEFGSWSKTKRDDYFKEHPENFGDPSNKAFPIKDQNDVEDAAKLIGHGSNPEKIKSRVKSIAKRLGLSIPATWETAKAKMENDNRIESPYVKFEKGNDSFKDGDYVVYPARKLFPAGWYESHQFGKSPEELLLDTDKSKNAPLDLEHKETVLKEEYIGFANNYKGGWEDDDYVMRGDVHIHNLLDPLLKEETKMSTTWDKNTRELVGVALLLDPKIPDATLKFAKQTWEGKWVMQDVHDQMSRHGAICNAPVGFVAQHEYDAIQKMHDAAVKAGAVCSFIDDNNKIGYEMTITDEEKKSIATTVVEFLKGIGGGKEEEKVDFRDKEIEKMRGELKTTKVNNFVDRVIGDGKALPGDAEIIKVLYAQAVDDDLKGGSEIKFGEKTYTNRADVIEDYFKSIKPRETQFSQELISSVNKNEQVLNSGSNDKSEDSDFVKLARENTRAMFGGGKK